jgi:hypothetical protein
MLDLGFATSIVPMHGQVAIVFKQGTKKLSMLLSRDGGTIVFEEPRLEPMIEHAYTQEEALRAYEQWFNEFFQRRATRHNPSGDRFRACVAKMRKRPGVYSPEGLCATIGRRKYGKAGYAKLIARGRRHGG